MKEQTSLIEGKNAHIHENNQGLEALKEQLEGYWNDIADLNEVRKIKEENQDLKEQLQRQKQRVDRMEMNTSSHLLASEGELQRIQGSYSKLGKQYQLIVAMMSIKDGELQKCQEEIKLHIVEHKRLVSQVTKLKADEKKFQDTLHESNEQISVLQKEKAAIQTELQETIQSAIKPQTSKYCHHLYFQILISMVELLGKKQSLVKIFDSRTDSYKMRVIS